MLVLTILFLLLNVSLLLRTSHRATHWGELQKFALGCGLCILGQLTINFILVITTSAMTGVFLSMGPYFPQLVAAFAAAAWTLSVLYWGYGWTYGKLGGV